MNYKIKIMTKLEAISAMSQGKKVTHRYFDKDEWVTMSASHFLFEDGVSCSPVIFWQYRQGKEWLIDWSEWTPCVELQ